MVLRGSDEATRAEALSALAALPSEDVLWVGDDHVGDEEVRFTTASHSGVKRLLGRAFDAVVLDLHARLDADVLGQCHGFVWGGGCLVLRMPPAGAHVPDERLAVAPFARADVTTRFAERLERCLARAGLETRAGAVGPASREIRGTSEQRALVERLASSFRSDTPSISVVIADRGRGKSSALGLALQDAMRDRMGARESLRSADPPNALRANGALRTSGESPSLGAPARHRELRVALTGPSESAVGEVLRFAPRQVRYVDPLQLVSGERVSGELAHEADYDVIVVDEAAQLPVPLLERLVLGHPGARIAFATTARGYEGTGRGFVLRFLEWLGAAGRPLASYTLSEPIRWGADDPLERFVFDALLLDAEPASIGEVDLEAVHHARLDRDALANDERLLREVFGLLVHAHYRTTPGDLQRMLDAPNLAVHASLEGERVVAATLIAREGGLAAEECAAIARGGARVRGHALAETLIVHAGRPDAGRLSMIRSVRIAVHPGARRLGIARALVDSVHASYAPDLFGTLFGATPELLRFRREVGYTLVRLGASRGARTGEPSAVMVRPVSAEARELVAALRDDLARDLPPQLELLEDELALDPRLAAELAVGLSAPAPLSDAKCDAIARGYTASSRPFESAAYAITRSVRAHADRLGALDPRQRALVEARVLDRRSWTEAARRAGYDTVPAAMRALRPAIAALLALARG